MRLGHAGPIRWLVVLQELPGVLAMSILLMNRSTMRAAPLTISSVGGRRSSSTFFASSSDGSFSVIQS
ncbi:hypothetical protein EAH75_04030 [Rhodanobacter glycinis]|nr:hypothetical protein EAH75_04030 [Rhodanobacter glycinis]